MTVARVMLVLIILFVGYFTYQNYRYYVMAHGYSYEDSVGCDFRFYYEAGRGNQYQHTVMIDGVNATFEFAYPPWTSIFWYWCRWTSNYEQAFSIWSGFLIACYAVFSWRFSAYGITGFLTILASIPYYSIAIGTGNIIPTLALMVLSPWGVVLACCFKFYLGAFIVPYFILAGTKNLHRTSIVRIREDVRRGVYRIRNLHLDFVAASAFFVITYGHYFQITKAAKAWQLLIGFLK